MLGDPKVLILDEPTAGLDPRERVQLRNHIRDLSRERTVLLATHILSDIETIADEILLLRAGSLVRSGAPAALVAEENCATLEEVCLRYIDDDE